MSGTTAWQAPRPMSSLSDYYSEHFPLRVYNSLTRAKDPFVPNDLINKNRVLWYMCGPTVYDETHLGHARTYTCSDVLRRILTDYFGYEVELVMNITDIDDKIILRSVEQGFCSQQNTDKATKEEMMSWAADQAVEENMQRAQTLAKKWEQSFLQDMASLGVQLPTVITRVSEYVPEVVDFISQVISNGFAYESNGSVYFDTKAFQQKKKYGKLLPENVGQSDLLAEGEGSLSNVKQEKRNEMDFVLWKKSKKGEPFWSSPWGEGRPGWHIECSAMASHALNHLGDVIDIHSGGIDLRFPHHDNELAQSEAFHDHNQWINYFIHTGHLNIEGLKMSKSLKNFVKIREALEHHSARQLRFLFLLHKYNQPMDYNDATMAEAVTYDKFFSNFFDNVKAKLRELPVESNQYWQEAEKKLHLQLLETKKQVRIALADDFNTPLAISHLQELVKQVNKYMTTPRQVSMIIRSAAEYVTYMFNVFGLLSSNTSLSSGLGFPLSESDSGNGISKEEVLTPVLDVLTKFRDEIRTLNRTLKNPEIMKLCDRLRDEDLITAGVRLEDRGTGDSIWKLGDVAQLMEEKKKKEEEKERKAQEKEQRRLDELEKKRKEAEQAEILPEMMFLSLTDKYSQFGDDGIPTHDHLNEELSKGQKKKLAKEQAKQKALYTKYHPKA